jgi:HNH endonuclease
MSSTKYRDLYERVLAQTVVTYCPELKSDCWIWVGPKLRAHYQDYGRIGIRVGGKVKNFLAHRFVFELFKEEKIPRGYEVDHICENGLCVAPDHLQAVSRKTNLEFRYYRGALIR